MLAFKCLNDNILIQSIYATQKQNNNVPPFYVGVLTISVAHSLTVVWAALLHMPAIITYHCNIAAEVSVL